MKTIIIGIHGKAYSGKDTLAEALRPLLLEQFPDARIEELRFAEPLYDMLRTRMPEAGSHLSKAEKELPRPELGGLSQRQALLAMGQGFHNVNPMTMPHIWAYDMRDMINTYTQDKVTSRLFVLVPDVRRDDEAQTLLGTENAVGVIYKVEAINGPTEENPDKRTEGGIFHDYVTAHLLNDHGKGKEAFAQKVREEVLPTLLCVDLNYSKMVGGLV